MPAPHAPFDALLTLILAPLPAPKQGQINEQFRAFGQTPPPDLEDAIDLHLFCAALQDCPASDRWPALDHWPDGWWLDQTFCRFWLAVHVDWKAADEVEWQVQAIARTLELPERWVREGAATDTFRVLCAAAAWLRARGFELLSLHTGGDEYLAVPIQVSLLRPALMATDRLGWKTSLF